MINVNPQYEVILTYSPIKEITGHLFECFDYYLFLRDYFKTGILLFGGLSMEQLKTAWESKYIDPFDDAANDIMLVGEEHLQRKDLQIVSFGKNTVVILADGNIKSLEYYKLVFSTTKLIGFLCEYDGFHEVKWNKNITYLMDYRVYNGKLKFFESIDYVKKLPFKHYIKHKPMNLNRGMMYMTYACRLVQPEVVLQCHEESRCDSSILVVPYKKPEYDGLPGITQIVAPVKDFFNQFDVYIYTPVGRKFDCSPRLLTECFMHGKKAICNVDYNDPGLQVRLEDCKNNLDGLNLLENDIILDVIQRRLGK